MTKDRTVDHLMSLGAGLRDPETGDVEFIVTSSAGDSKLYAHKHVLSAMSDYFRASLLLDYSANNRVFQRMVPRGHYATRSCSNNI